MQLADMQAALDDSGGNVAAAARSLGIARTTFLSRREALQRQADSQNKDARKLGATQAEVNQLKNRLELAQEQIKALRSKRKTITGKPKPKPKGSFERVVIPDTHGCYIDKPAVKAFLHDLASMDPPPAEIVMLGDHLDCGGFLAQHHTLGFVAEAAYTFADDVAAANEFLDRVQEAAPNATIHMLEGNHECLSGEHDVLTRDGWKAIADVSTTDTVASMTSDGEVVWGNPVKVHSYEHDGEMVRAESPAWRSLMTPNHRVVYWSQDGQRVLERQAKHTIDFSVYHIPVAAHVHEDLPGVSDEMLRVLGWILTDACMCRNAVTIYQSKPDNLQRIRDILHDAGIEFGESNKPAEGDYLDAFVFNIAAKSRDQILQCLGIDRKCDTEDKIVPQWMLDLSDRQFELFATEVMRADGSKAKSPGTAHAIYGRKDRLESLQSLFVTHGWAASLRERTTKDDAVSWSAGSSFWVLNVCRRDRRKIEGNRLSPEDFCGTVYCLTMPAGNFVTRYQGCVSVTGNSRIEKWIITQVLRNEKDGRLLAEMFSAKSMMNVEERGIHYYSASEFHHGLRIRGAIKLGKCHFTHGISTAKHAAASTVAKFGGSIVYGHTHRADSYIIRTVGAGEIGAWSPGCLCEIQPYYGYTNLTNWSHGYGIQRVTKGGEFLHINVPIIDGLSLWTC